MKKVYFVSLIKFVSKYVIPIVLGWLEGDSHTVQDFLFSIL